MIAFITPLFFSWWLGSSDLPRVIPPPCSPDRFWYCPEKELFPFVYIWRTLDDSGVAKTLSDVPSGAVYKKYVGIFTL